MECAYCGGALKVYEFQLKATTPQRAPCEKCGSNHVIHEGRVEAINPRPLPADHDDARVAMPWRARDTRPIDKGFYECRFTEIEPRMIYLWWNGEHFSHADQRVAMRTFIAWRGAWA
jgi:hypothetical protein